MKKSSRFLLLLGFFVLLDCLLWGQIFFTPSFRPSFFMLDVGQGDSSLVIFPEGGVMMTDAGPDRSVTRALDTFSLPTSRYIDLAVITHPQLDHYGGFIDLLDHYEVGAFLVTGREPDQETPTWETLKKKIQSQGIPLIQIQRGDRILQGSSSVDVLSPDGIFRESGELNDSSVVARVRMASTSILLTGDIGEGVESFLVAHDVLQSDILKVPHHGSRYSSSYSFLEAVAPKIAVIGVGENRYGHPTQESLDRIARFVSDRIFRTDLSGSIQIVVVEGILRVFTGGML